MTTDSCFNKAIVLLLKLFCFLFLSCSIDSLVDQLNDKRYPHSVHYSALQLDNGAFCLAQFPSDHKFSYFVIRWKFYCMSLSKVVSWYGTKLQQF